MGIEPLLDRFARVRGRGRAARAAGRVVLCGAALAAALLFLARAGFATPLVHLPGMPDAPGAAERVFGYLLVSLAGILQGLFLLALVFALALAVRLLGGRLLRPGRRAVARVLDRAARTDRFTAALEASGPLGPLVVRAAAAFPPAGALRPRPPRQRERWLRRLAVALVLIVAIAPGTAPGAEGAAPVAGEPEGGRADAPLLLTLAGERGRYPPKRPVPVQVIGEAVAAPAEDLHLPVRVAIDGGAPTDSGVRLFLPAGAPGQDAAVFDLRAVAGDLAPGEHRAVAFAGAARSNAYVFRIEEEGGGSGGGAAQPEPEPEPEPRPDQRPRPDGGADPDWRPKFVEPLVREGETVRKSARVPIEVPGGAAPEPRTLDEAWPELERRREAALDRPGLSPAARKLIREYFDKLRPEAPR